jgi:hypothetical protein
MEHSTINKYEQLEPAEAALAQVLLKNNLVPTEVIENFIDFKKQLLSYGKPFLGDILITMNYISRADLEQFIKESDSQHIDFVGTLKSQGYLTEAQHDQLLQKYKETGKNITSLLLDLGIMPKEIYNKLFNKRVYSLKLGEWLMANKKITQSQLDDALSFRSMSSLESYLVKMNFLKGDTLQKVKERMSAI